MKRSFCLPSAFSFVVGLSVVFSGAFSWNFHSSLPNATAPMFDGGRFVVHVLPDEILNHILLAGFNCSLLEDQVYIEEISIGSEGTLLRWNNKAPPETDVVSVKLNCAPSNLEANWSIVKARKQRVARDVSDSSISVSTVQDPTKQTVVTTEDPVAVHEQDSAETLSPTIVTSRPTLGAETAATDHATETIPTTLPVPTIITETEKLQTTVNSTPNVESSHVTARDSTVEKMTTEQPIRLETTTAEEQPPTTTDIRTEVNDQAFRLEIVRVSLDFVGAQTLPSLFDAINISSSLEEQLLARENGIDCFVEPKEVRVIKGSYVIFGVGLNSSTGVALRGSELQRTCALDNWQSAREFLTDIEHARSLDAKIFHLQILSVALAAVVIVFALLAVFLCIKWRLAVRGSKRDASDGFYVKTFHTKEHHYAADSDDFYGFPTIRRDSTFHRTGGTGSNAPNGRGYFVNGAFQESEDQQHLPPPPPDMRSCIINDENFTDVPLHNLGSDSLRAHRGVQRQQSPPPPPLRTVSSGYMSGHSTPAVEYHNPQELMVLPPIPKEDYSDAESDSEASSGTPTKQLKHVEQKGRFTVRTAL